MTQGSLLINISTTLADLVLKKFIERWRNQTQPPIKFITTFKLNLKWQNSSYCYFFPNLKSQIPCPIYFSSPSFPSNPQKRVKWLANMHRKDWTPSSHSRICSDHFEERFLNRTDQIVKLKDEAVPIRFKKFPEHLKKVIICN